MDVRPQLTVVVPAFNESRRLANSVPRLKWALEDERLCADSIEFIVVDDGSTDGTAIRAEELLAEKFPLLRVLRIHDNAGKGAAIRVGTAAATAPVVIYMDADMAADPNQIPKLAHAIGPADIAIGSRAHSESVVVSSTVQRKVMGRTFNAMVGALTNMPFRDTQCGFKALRTPLARLLFHFARVDRFAFDVDLLTTARRLGMNITEVGIHWREVDGSTVRSLVEPISMAKDVLGVARRRRWPHVPALEVVPASGERRRSRSRIWEELYSCLGPNFPILAPSENATLVLLPLCEPLEVHDIATHIRHLPTRLRTTERSVSFSEMTELSPFEWLPFWDGGLAVAARTDLRTDVLATPVGKWPSAAGASERSNGHRRPRPHTNGKVSSTYAGATRQRGGYGVEQSA